jgi:hypothetical protein
MFGSCDLQPPPPSLPDPLTTSLPHRPVETHRRVLRVDRRVRADQRGARASGGGRWRGGHVGRRERKRRGGRCIMGTEARMKVKKSTSGKAGVRTSRLIVAIYWHMSHPDPFLARKRTFTSSASTSLHLLSSTPSPSPSSPPLSSPQGRPPRSLSRVLLEASHPRTLGPILGPSLSRVVFLPAPSPPLRTDARTCGGGKEIPRAWPR